MNNTKKRPKNQHKYATQRAERPGELLMICNEHPAFARRLVAEFRKLAEEKGSRNE